PLRVCNRLSRAGTVSSNSARRSPSFADSSGSVASVPCSNTNVATAFTRSWPWMAIWPLFSLVQVLKLTLKRGHLLLRLGPALTADPECRHVYFESAVQLASLTEDNLMVVVGRWYSDNYHRSIQSSHSC